MTYTKKTLRKLKGPTRQIAEAVNRIELGLRAIQRNLPKIEHLQHDADALDKFLAGGIQPPEPNA